MSRAAPRWHADAAARATVAPLGLVAAALGWLAAMIVASSIGDAGGFSWHMVVHLLNVTAIASALAVRLRPSRSMPAPIVAAFVEFVVVWAWHTPIAYAAARTNLAAYLIEQASFVAAAYLLWAVVVDAAAQRDRGRMAQSVIALLLTSMHMTLLGAALALAAASPYPEALCGGTTTGLTPLADVRAGGALMLGVAAAVYLVAALGLARRLLDRPQA
jgi:putative membrane protein